jgi:transposase
MFPKSGEATVKDVTTIGVDLAKNVIQVHGVDRRGKAVLKKQLPRRRFVEFFANLAPCLVGMEACASAHYWARQLEKLGHQVKLMAPQFVKPYVKTNKNDAADAEAICEAVSRPTMRFVPIKNGEQQAVLALHRARAGFVKARTAQANQIRGLLGEYGIFLPQGIVHITRCLPALQEDGENELPGTFRQLLVRLGEHLKELDRQVRELEAQIQEWHRTNEASSRLAKIPGIGPLTASALVATLGDARSFKNARQLAAWLGLVPRQYSSGGKTLLLGISKRGDSYLRTLLIHGARSVIRVAERKAGDSPTWLTQLIGRRHKNVAAVALANKNARTVWALLAHDRAYDAEYVPAVV